MCRVWKNLIDRGLFLSCLRADIRLNIRSRDARTLSVIIHLAKENEHEVEGLSETGQMAASVSSWVLSPEVNF